MRNIPSFSLLANFLFSKMSEQSNRFANVDESIDTFIEKQCNQNTLSKTHRDIELLKKFLAFENEEREIHNIEPKALNNYISEFIVKVRKQDGGEYEPTTLRSFISSFDRFLRKKNYPTTIIEGDEFRKTRECLAAKQRELKKEGKGNKPNAARALTDEEVDILYGLNLLGSANGEALLNTVWLNNTQHFGLRGCQEHRDMKWGDVELKTTADGLEYLEYNERQTKTRTGSQPKDTRTVKPKMFAVRGSERDPVLFYRQYASKRPDDMNNKDSPFYLAINHTRNPASGKPWFKSAPMGVNKLNALLKIMAQKAELDTSNLSNHSARKRMIQKLSEQNVPPTHIMQVSGHKNVQSINNYSCLSVQQQRDISNILAVSGRTSSAIDRTTFNRMTVDVQQETEEMSTHQPIAMFHGAQISGGTFNITVNTLNQSPTMPATSRQSTSSEPDEKRPRHYFIESDSE